MYVEFEQKFPHCNVSHLPAQLRAWLSSTVSSPGSTLLFIFSAIKYILSPGYSHKRRRALLRREIGQLSTGDCRSAILLAFNFSPFLQIINFCSDKFSIPVPSSYIVYEERLWLQWNSDNPPRQYITTACKLPEAKPLIVQVCYL